MSVPTTVLSSQEMVHVERCHDGLTGVSYRRPKGILFTRLFLSRSSFGLTKNTRSNTSVCISEGENEISNFYLVIQFEYELLIHSSFMCICVYTICTYEN